MQMIKQLVSFALPIGENLTIVKNRIMKEGTKESEPRISIVTGIHGDELEGQYICYELTRRIQENINCLSGTLDIYPALNPLGIDTANRYVPKSDMDLNRMFPGSKSGTLMEKVAAVVVEDLMGSDICIDLHASDIFVKELPQVRVSEHFAEKLLPFAKLLNVDMVWMNATATVHESTLAHTLNSLSIPTLVIEMGLGKKINRSYGNQIVDGILNLMHEMGFWKMEVENIKTPVVSKDGQVEFIRAKNTGVFIPWIEHNHFVKKGQKIGEVINVLEGKVEEEILAGEDGLVFTLREYPMVYEGALLGRILIGINKEGKVE